MGPLALLGFAALCAGLAQAEVVRDFSRCKQFFYRGEAPRGFGTATTASICQRYNNRHHFATFYDKRRRIPVWSAYTLDPKRCTKPISEAWKVEPQLSGFNVANMQTEGQLKDKITPAEKQQIKEKLKQTQAINEDYEKTGYDRGHLNPKAFQCDDGRTATFTLTNAAPMDPCFNRIRWFELERHLKDQLNQHCPAPKANAFLVTGTVPNDQEKIPKRNYDKSRGIVREPGRVVVPGHIWTAVCCEHANNNQKFAFAFLGKNRPDSILEPMTVTQLNQKLAGLYGKRGLQIFRDDCNEGGRKAREVLSAITKQLCGDLPNWVQDACQQTKPRPTKHPRAKSGKHDA